MALRAGELYRCPKYDCGCEVQVVKKSGTGGGDLKPICCCGSVMQRERATSFQTARSASAVAQA